jgi:nucleotide sugar dehydrogenase
MLDMMNIKDEDLASVEKCHDYTASVIECSKVGIFHIFLFAEAGFNVIGVATNPHAQEMLNRGRTPFSRKNYLLEKYLKTGFFTVSSDITKATAESNIIVVAPQTPIDRRKRPNYTVLEKTCREIGLGLKKGSLVLLVSATGPGTVEERVCEVSEKAAGLKAGEDFALAFSPIQMGPTESLSSAANSSRAIGAVDESSRRAASVVLNRVSKSDVAVVSSIKTVELLNLLQAAKSEISQAFSNEIAMVCEKLNIDFLEIMEVSNKDTRFHLPKPGITNGPPRRDFYLLQDGVEKASANLNLTHLARKINDDIATHTFRLVKDALKVCGKTVRRSKLSVLGISSHPDTKQAPGALVRKTLNLLKGKVRTVEIYDPYFSKKEFTELRLEGKKLSKAVEKTDCVVILTGHSRFERLNLKKVKLLAKKSPALVDIGQVIDPLKAEKYGFVYRGLGRGVWTK